MRERECKREGVRERGRSKAERVNVRERGGVREGERWRGRGSK